MSQQIKHVRVLAALAAASIAGLASVSHAGQQFSFESPGDIDPTILPAGNSENVNWVWGGSYGGGNPRVSHTQSALNATDGNFSMLLDQPLSSYQTDTQVNMSPDDGAGGPHTLAFANYAASTKLLIDITTPAHGPGYQTLDAQLNFGGGSDGSGAYHYVGAYSGNYYQFVDGNPGGDSPRTVARTQTYTWDFGGQMSEVLGSVLPDLGGYTILHLSTGNGGAAGGDASASATSQYFLDNVHFLNEDVSTRSTYNKITAGSWTDSSNWAHGVPNAVGAPAIFNGTGAGNGTVAANTTVTLNSGVTVGSIIFDALVTSFDYAGASNSFTSADALPQIVNYTIAGTGSLSINNGSNTSEIYVLAGSHNINVPVSVASNLSIDTSAGFSSDNNPGLPGGGRHSSVAMTSLSFGSPVTLAANTTLTTRGAGTVTFAAIRGGGALAVNGGYTAISQKGTANSPTGTSVVTSLTLGNNAKFDLTNNSMVLDYTGTSSLNSTRLALAAGSILSSSIAGNPGTAIGYGESSVVLGAGGGTFGGQGVDGSAVLLKFTYSGDTNLDGKVDISDLGNLASHWQQPGVWTAGDFNYDGVVNISDLGLLATNWQKGVNSPLFQSFGDAAASLGLPGSSVPEPATLTAVFGSLGLLLNRRRRA